LGRTNNGNNVPVTVSNFRAANENYVTVSILFLVSIVNVVTVTFCGNDAPKEMLKAFFVFNV
jgi:hypothetical protein